MIVRPPQHWFRRLFVWHGSVLPNILFRLSLNFMVSCLAVLCYHWHEDFNVNLTLGPFSLLGVAIAIFLGFRNNASYARFIEARVLWGSLLITTRSLMRQAISLMPHPGGEHRRFAMLLTAFTYALKHHLRHEPMAMELTRLLPAQDKAAVLASYSPCNRLLQLMGQWLGEQRRRGYLSDIDFQTIDTNLNQLSVILGGCERISNTPIPFAYSLIVHRTVYVFCALLPFALVTVLHYMTPLVSVFISYTFIALDALAEELEDPFGIEANDLPLNAMAHTVESNLRDMINDHTHLARVCPDSHCRLD